jgi:cyclohexanone monooxygenase
MVPVIAKEADRLFVFQRNPHFAVPARNGPTASGLQESIGRNLAAERERMFTQLIVPRGLKPPEPVAHYTPAQRLARMEHQWEFGGHGMTYLFSDQAVDKASNAVVASFVKDKIRQMVSDPVLAEKLCPTYPIGTHRLILEIGYYDAFNQDHVTLVDVKENPIAEVTETGVRTTEGHYDLDLLIFALGFQAFTGALDAAGIRNQIGQLPGEVWTHGPRTLLGLMIPGFPNMFTVTGAGSPATLFHLFLMNEFHIEWISDVIGYMDHSGRSTIEPSEAACDAWGLVAASYAERLLRRQEDSYLVHVNANGERIFLPFAGPMYEYVSKARAVVDRGYDGFLFNE